MMTPEEEEVAKKAREEAEARRKRILEAADARVRSFTGEHKPKVEVVEEGEDDDAPAAVHEKDEGDKDDAQAEATTPAAAPAKSSAASKMAAARRRRFKKGAAKEETADSATSTTTTTTTTTTPSPETPAVESAVKEEAPEPPPAAEAVEKAESKPKDEPVEGVVEAATTTKDETKEPESGSSAKKYMGVARMRRKMLKEKQKETEQEEEQVETTTTPSTRELSKKMKKKKVIEVLPILMHVVTVLLLFLAGLDVGLQQQRLKLPEATIVHQDLAPRQLGLLILQWNKKTAIEAAKIEVPEEEWEEAVMMEDEFDNGKLDSERDDNLDPLFQVDLDKLTQGSGLYFWLARFAVSLHRLNLSIFYYFPISIYNSIVNTVWQLVQTPPMLCLVALAMRQVVAKIVLGAQLPTGSEEGSPKQQDVLDMIKNFATGMVTRSFPTLVGLWDAWGHLRKDMYVIVCGLMVGLALTYSTTATTTFQTKETMFTGSDELFQTEETIPGSDEL